MAWYWYIVIAFVLIMCIALAWEPMGWLCILTCSNAILAE